jgi:hypothetical protein
MVKPEAKPAPKAKAAVGVALASGKIVIERGPSMDREPTHIELVEAAMQAKPRSALARPRMLALPTSTKRTALPSEINGVKLPSDVEAASFEELASILEKLVGYPAKTTHKAYLIKRLGEVARGKAKFREPKAKTIRLKLSAELTARLEAEVVARGFKGGAQALVELFCEDGLAEGVIASKAAR